MEEIPDTIALGSSRSFLLRASCLGLEKTENIIRTLIGATDSLYRGGQKVILI